MKVAWNTRTFVYRDAIATARKLAKAHGRNAYVVAHADDTYSVSPHDGGSEVQAVVDPSGHASSGNDYAAKHPKKELHKPLSAEEWQARTARDHRALMARRAHQGTR